MTKAERVPIPVPDADIRQMPIGPEEAFVFSRVDGHSTEADIGASTGLPADRVRQHINRLHQLGAIQIQGDSARPNPTASSARDPVPSEPVRDTLPSGGRPPGSGTNAPGPPSAPAAPTRSVRINSVFDRLDQHNYYELLGVDEAADRATIKAAYFELIGDFHPDKYYGEDLGNLKPKLTRIFQRMTEAHDTLTRARRRREYDESLGPSHNRTKPRSRPATDNPQPASSGGYHGVGPEAADPAGAATRNSPVPTAPRITEVYVERERDRKTPLVPSGSLPRQTGSTLQSIQMPRLSQPPSSVRSVVARRLKPGRSPSLRAPGSGPVQGPASSPRASSNSPGRLSQGEVTSVRPQRPSLVNGLVAKARSRGPAHYIQRAEQARAEGNLIGVVNALRIATSFQPDDRELKRRLEEAEREADAANAAQLVVDAKRADESGDTADATRLYGRAARATRSATLFTLAAECALKGDSDLRTASEHTKRALELEPDNPKLHLLLGRIYASAGMKASALAEIEKAAKLDPADQEVNHWLKRVRQT